jgi:hypothetical protein
MAERHGGGQQDPATIREIGGPGRRLTADQAEV